MCVDGNKSTVPPQKEGWKKALTLANILAPYIVGWMAQQVIPHLFFFFLSRSRVGLEKTSLSVIFLYFTVVTIKQNEENYSPKCSVLFTKAQQK